MNKAIPNKPFPTFFLIFIVIFLAPGLKGPCAFADRGEGQANGVAPYYG